LQKLLFFTENYSKGGGNRYLIDLINSLAKDEDEVFLISNIGGIFPEDTRRLKRRVKHNSIIFITRIFLFSRINYFGFYNKFWRRLISIPLFLLEPFFGAYNIFRFTLLCYQLKPDRVIACNGGYPAAKTCIAMTIAGSLLKIPTILSIVSMPSRRSRYLIWYEKVLDAFAWRTSGVVIVNARAISGALSDEREMPPSKSYIIYSGLDISTPIDLDRNNRSFAEKGDFVIGFISRLDHAKGVLFLFDAFVSLLNTYPNLKLVMVGNGDASDELASRTKHLGLQDRVKLPGYVAGDISALYSMFNIYVFPSLWEGFPYSILEALRAGCVILTTDVGGISEAITDGLEGVLIKPGSSMAIAKALDRLINDTEFCAQLSKNAKIKFERNFTLEKMEKRVQKLLTLT
jgi:glycosyltransferase involved in cell wall biosynthesis